MTLITTGPLPEWATLRKDHPGPLPRVDVDAKNAYEAMRLELGFPEKWDQYTLEVVYQCIKMELQLAMRADAFRCEIHIHDPTKQFAQKQFPKGRGAAAATKQREAREHFRRIRGVVPGGA